jgi:non-homologous end joining protein Ku
MSRRRKGSTREHIVKGFEIEKDQFVVVRQADLEAAMPKATKAIEIQDFVELDSIDPLYFDRPYFVAPKPREPSRTSCCSRQCGRPTRSVSRRS